MRVIAGSLRGRAVLIGFATATGWIACSCSDREFVAVAPPPRGDGGASTGGAGAAGEAPADGGSSGEPISEAGTSNDGGGGVRDTGVMAGGTPNTGGEGGASNAPGCDAVYNNWFRATFPYPQGGILGAADFPSSPWRTISGELTTQAGAATSSGKSLAVANQGKSLGGDIRARFKLSFASPEQSVTLRMNADREGKGGLAIRVARDTGEVTVSSGAQALATSAFGALQSGKTYFVQASRFEDSLEATLSAGNYAGVPGATEIGTLVLDHLSSVPNGTYAAIELNGTGTSIDDLSLSICGASPPEYTTLLRDTFTRANSMSPGKPDLPVTSTWSTTLGTGASIDINTNALALSQGAYVHTNQGQHYRAAGLRFRSSARFDTLGWFVLHYNQKADRTGGSGFDLWRETETNVFIEYGGATGSGRYPFNLDVASYYFLQFDLDGETAIATVRSGSYEGPILFGSSAEGIVDSPVEQTTFSIGNTWTSELAITEVFVDQYVP